MTATDGKPPPEPWVVLRPHDTVQVRDGRSFDAGAGGIAHSVRPWPSTVAGAVAAALGGEPDSVRGPVLARREDREWGLYLPVPADLVVEPDTEDVWRLHLPHEADEGDAASSDLHETAAVLGAAGLRLLSVPGEVPEADPLTGLVPGRILASYLRGDLVEAGRVTSTDDLEQPADPVQAEPRIGVGLDPDARTVKGGLLYRTTHLRLAEEWAFAAHLSPHPTRHRALGEVADPVRFGGLSRLADVEHAPGLAWPDAVEAYPGGRVLMYVATPAVWPAGWLPPLPEKARLVAARVGEPLPVATASPRHDYRHFQHTRALSWAVPAGSVYLLQFPNPDDAATWAVPQHGRALGPPARPHWDTAGFGVVLTGVWS